MLKLRALRVALSRLQPISIRNCMDSTSAERIWDLDPVVGHWARPAVRLHIHSRQLLIMSHNQLIIRHIRVKGSKMTHYGPMERMVDRATTRLFRGVYRRKLV